jgi:protein gp37
MNKTKIEWVKNDDGTQGYTWNPVTGCLHGCKYCYARKQANRFKGFDPRMGGEANLPEGNSICKTSHCEKLHVFDKAPMIRKPDIRNWNDNWRKAQFPYGFDPTFHRYRLDEPQKVKKPSTVFVGSMTDLFGEWVPDEWITAVFEACAKAPQHRYIFLTKNPKRYGPLEHPDNFYFGATATTEKEFKQAMLHDIDFVSIEPIAELFCIDEWIVDIAGNVSLKWVIVGAESGNRKGKIIPEREWIEAIAADCQRKNIPLFMKDSLKDIWGEPLIQQLPWEVG